MNRLILAVLVVLFMFCAAYADVGGIPLRDDQYAHIGIGAYLTKLCKSYGMNEFESAVVVFGLSYLKETYDSNRTGFSWEDIGYSMGGCCLSYSVDFALDI